MNKYPLNLELRKANPSTSDLADNIMGITGTVMAISFVLLATSLWVTVSIPILVGGAAIIASILIHDHISPKKKNIRKQLEQESRKLQAHMKTKYKLELSESEAYSLFKGRDVSVTREDSTKITINLNNAGAIVVLAETTLLSSDPELETKESNTPQEKILPTQFFEKEQAA